jgi:RNA ligase (TIGR02306 family)
MDRGLAYTGKIIAMEQIPNADFIACATVVCGQGGKWRGVVRKAEADIGLLCTVYLPDALIPPSEDMEFMKSTNWRVKMRRFRGAPSEVVIVPLKIAGGDVGFDCTDMLGVTKYQKPVPANLQGVAEGEFPGFIPKTDEPNYQSVQEMVDALHGLPYYITEKADGSSTTAYKYKGKFGVCSRNWEMKRDENNGYWKVALQHQLESRLPEGYAIQWETCGPKIQSNPMGFPNITGLAFSGYNIESKCYLNMQDFLHLCADLQFPISALIESGESFNKEGIESKGEGKYKNGKEREGVVIRSAINFYGHKPISFKVINLNYEK